MATVSCALVQMSFVRDKSRNVARGAERIQHAAAGGAQIVCLPELATTIYPAYVEEPAYRDLAEPIPGPATDEIGRAAAAAGVYVVYPMYERAADGALFNTAVFIDRSGAVAGLYRKNMIPDVRMPVMTGMEKFYFEPGNLGYPVFPTELGVNVGIAICYERHFPEATRSLALAGADLILLPTATAAGADIWEVELRAHAIANLLWVGGVNRVGLDEDGSQARFYGRSQICSPSGEVVARAGDDAEEIVFATIDTAVSARLRDEWGFFRDRRPDTYGGLTETRRDNATPPPPLAAGALQAIVEELRARLAAGRCTLRVATEDGGFPVMYESLGPGARSVAGDTVTDLSKQPVPNAILAERTQVVQRDSRNSYADPEFHQMLDRYGNVGAQIVTPVVNDAALGGLLSVHHLGSARDWTDAETRLASEAATLAGRLLTPAGEQ
jgi:N-carbamoylputrescine amidase